MKENKNNLNRREARELRYNRRLSVKELASHYGRSERTIYRWLSDHNKNNSPDQQDHPKRHIRSRKYPLDVFIRITEFKEELPYRTAPIVRKLLKKEFPNATPSLSTIYKYFHDQGLTYKNRSHRKGYVKFERSKPNDLWQIDIAGVQTVGHLEKLYLIALLDDNSRFIVAAEYFKDQRGLNVLKIIRDAVLAYGRPNQILADNGTQFRNLIGELGTKYTRLLENLDITPIFAKPNHPQTKGKLERWFGTVKKMFLGEARFKVKTTPKLTLTDFNQMFREWVIWYNTEKPHRSLPGNHPPNKRFYETEDRIFRPLQAEINWKRWLHELEQTKVTKYNEIYYKSQKYHIPPGYSGTRVEVIEYEDKIEIYYKDKLIISHSYNVPIRQKKIKRKITHAGVIMYKGKPYTIDYKLAGRTVEVQEINDGKNLLVYLHGKLLKTIDL
ncbi:MAG: transposase [Promethearchaeota archaeon]|nr:MAG: transposase [Candidatus Lokiarchaeota archaeon]